MTQEETASHGMGQAGPWLLCAINANRDAPATAFVCCLFFRRLTTGKRVK